jgi:hypothetical protein
VESGLRFRGDRGRVPPVRVDAGRPDPPCRPGDPGAASVVSGLAGHDYSKPAKPDSAWDDKDARDELVSRLVTDAHTVLASIDVGPLTDVRQETVALLALVAGQDVEPAEGSDGTDGPWRIARRIARTG